MSTGSHASWLLAALANDEVDRDVLEPSEKRWTVIQIARNVDGRYFGCSCEVGDSRSHRETVDARIPANTENAAEA